MNTNRLTPAILMSLLFSFGLLAGCDDNDPIENMGDHVEELGDDIQESANDARREIDDATD